MLATISVSGWVKEDFQLMAGKDGLKYVRFDLAVTKGYGNKERKEYYECLGFGQTAERLITAGVKGGSLIEVAGDLEIRDYERKDGTKTKIPKITIYNWGYLPRAKKETANN